MNNIYKEVSLKLCLPVEVVEKIYKSYYEFLRAVITDLPESYLENPDNYKTSFTIPSIGKLYYNDKKQNKIKNNL